MDRGAQCVRISGCHARSVRAAARPLFFFVSGGRAGVAGTAALPAASPVICDRRRAAGGDRRLEYSPPPSRRRFWFLASDPIGRLKTGRSCCCEPRGLCLFGRDRHAAGAGLASKRSWRRFVLVFSGHDHRIGGGVARGISHPAGADGACAANLCRGRPSLGRLDCLGFAAGLPSWPVAGLGPGCGLSCG